MLAEVICRFPIIGVVSQTSNLASLQFLPQAVHEAPGLCLERRIWVRSAKMVSEYRYIFLLQSLGYDLSISKCPAQNDGNDDVINLYNRVQVGAKVIVLPQAAQVAQSPAEPRQNRSRQGYSEVLER